MQIVKLKIENFRAIRTCEFFPTQHNVLLGPNNSGKTAILEALNCLLNPEFSFRTGAIDENDFFNRNYLEKKIPIPTSPVIHSAQNEPSMAPPQADAPQSQEGESSNEKFIVEPAPRILIEAILAPIDDPKDRNAFRDSLVSWDPEQRSVLEATEEGKDPFAQGKQTAIWVALEALYDPNEDEFVWRTYLKKHSAMKWNPDDEISVPILKREQKLRIGFLIYRDIRALQRPVTLDPSGLFMRVFESQEAKPTNFESAFDKTEFSLRPLTTDGRFGAILKDIKDEFQAYLPLSKDLSANLDIELTDRTRNQFKANAQLYVNGKIRLPIQKYGAGTRSLATLGLLTYIMRKRNRGIIALEEPETFLFPHAQRRVVSEARSIATQTFVTTHSPYVLEQFQVENISRVDAREDGTVLVTRLDPQKADPALFKRQLRKVIAEALLSRAVLVFEEDSIARWVGLLSEKLAGKIIDGVRIEQLDLAGISAIGVDGNGQVVPVASFTETAGLPTLICVDHIKNVPAVTAWCNEGKPHVMLKQKGIEELFIEEITDDLLEKIVTEAVGAYYSPIDRTTFQSLSTSDKKKTALEFLKNNKGSIPFHEWMASLVDETTAPKSLVGILVAAFKLITPTLETTLLEASLSKTDLPITTELAIPEGPSGIRSDS